MRITYSVMPTVLTEPLRSGEVKPDGLELDVFDPKTTDSNSRDMLKLRFDVAEMSIAALSKAVERGLPLVALPVFTSGRRFVQSGIYLTKNTDVTSPRQLRGRTVGLPQYWISSCIWQRMVLKQMYGITPEHVRWVSEQPERFDGVGAPPGVELRLDPAGDLAALARTGEIDAVLMPGGRPLPPDLADVTVPAYPDCVAAEREYFAARRVFPLMHVTVVQRSLIEREPGVVEALLDAYTRAKRAVGSRPDGDWPLPPLGHDLPALRELLGDDPWPYGITPNRAALEAFLQGALDQGLLRQRLRPEQIFAEDLPQDFR